MYAYYYRLLHTSIFAEKLAMGDWQTVLEISEPRVSGLELEY